MRAARDSLCMCRATGPLHEGVREATVIFTAARGVNFTKVHAARVVLAVLVVLDVLDVLAMCWPYVGRAH
eukprot:2277552-Prymnesium_polylepis.1